MMMQSALEEKDTCLASNKRTNGSRLSKRKRRRTLLPLIWFLLGSARHLIQRSLVLILLLGLRFLRWIRQAVTVSDVPSSLANKGSRSVA